MILYVASTLRFDPANSYSFFRIHTSKTYKDIGNVKLLNVYVEVGLDLFITLKNASPNIWNLCFPLWMMPMSVRGYNKTCQRQKKINFFFNFKNNFKTPKLWSHQSGQSYIVPSPNKQTNPQSSNTKNTGCSGSVFPRSKIKQSMDNLATWVFVHLTKIKQSMTRI